MAERKRTKSRSMPDRQSYLNHRMEAETIDHGNGTIERCLMVPERHAVTHCRLTELVIEPDRIANWPEGATDSERIWHVIDGAGLMTRDTDQFAIVPGDVIHIARGIAHQVHSRGQRPLQLLCVTCPSGDQPAA